MVKKAPIAKKEKQSQKKSTVKQNFELFTTDFYSTLDNFTNFYREVLQLKSKANGTSLNDQFIEVSNRFRKQLQDASSKIMQNQLKALQVWIEKEQEYIAAEIDSIKSAHNNTQQSLRSTGAFSEEQIKKQLSVIQSKINNKKQVQENYKKMLEESKSIYKVTE